MSYGYTDPIIRNDDEDGEDKDAPKTPDYVGKALFESRTILITGGISEKPVRHARVRTPSTVFLLQLRIAWVLNTCKALIPAIADFLGCPTS